MAATPAALYALLHYLFSLTLLPLPTPSQHISGLKRDKASVALLKQVQLRKFADRFEIDGLFDLYFPGGTRPFSEPDESVKTVIGVVTGTNAPPLLECRRRRLNRTDAIELCADEARKEDDITLRFAFHDAVAHVLAGDYPVNERDALSLAALHAFALHDGVIRRDADLRTYFSERSAVSAKPAVLRSALELAVANLDAELTAMSHAAPKVKAKRTYLQLLKTRLPNLYGACVYKGTIVEDGLGVLRKMEPTRIAISEAGIALISTPKRSSAEHTASVQPTVFYTHGRIVRWAASVKTNVLHVSISERSEIRGAAKYQLSIRLDELGAPTRAAKVLREHCHAWAEIEMAEAEAAARKPRAQRRGSIQLSATAEAGSAGAAAAIAAAIARGAGETGAATTKAATWRVESEGTEVLFVQIDADGVVKERRSTPPAEILLPGWEVISDDEANDVFYYNAAEERSTWDPPLLAGVRERMH